MISKHFHQHYTTLFYYKRLVGESFIYFLKSIKAQNNFCNRTDVKKIAYINNIPLLNKTCTHILILKQYKKRHYYIFKDIDRKA